MPAGKNYITLSLLLLMVISIAYLVAGFDYSLSEPVLEPVEDEDENTVPEVIRTERVLKPGTALETTLHIITAPEPGPTVMIIGGVHGDEPAGYLAAEIIATWEVDRGVLLVLPRACVPAIEANDRFTAGMDDLNMYFPGNASGNATERLAAAIYGVMEEFRPDWVIDLHEAQEFERVQYRALGQTIIYPYDGLYVEVVDEIIERLNLTIAEELHQYQIKRGGWPGGSIRAARSLDLETFTTESTRKLPIEDRIDQQLAIVRLLFCILEVNIYE